LRRGVHPASKPFRRKPKSNSFRETEIPPFFPERTVGGRSIEEECQFIHVQDSQAAAKKMPHRMPARVVECVHRMQRRQTNAIEFRRAPSPPKPFRAGRLKSERRIAEPKVHLCRERLIGIEVITAPSPTGAPHHHGQMVRTLRFFFTHLVAE
jgi:hypothetical protein